MNSKALALQKASLGQTIKGTLPFNPQKPTIVLTKKQNPTPEENEQPKKIYYKKAYA